jgi:CheY-like chemotaxis protein
MGLDIAEYTIQQVLVVEDNPSAREGYQYTLEDMDLEPVLETGPLRDIVDYVASATERCDAAICDHHLAESGYADFNGARFVAEMNSRQRPAVLCTAWEEAAVDEIRLFRRNIPCLLKPSDLDPENLRHALELCIDEFHGRFRPSRYPSRTLVRVEDVDRDNAYVILPGWNPQEVIRLPLRAISTDVNSSITVGARVHARVNIGAERQEELYFYQWETT